MRTKMRKCNLPIKIILTIRFLVAALISVSKEIFVLKYLVFTLLKSPAQIYFLNSQIPPNSSIVEKPSIGN